jgi:uncharacterized protein (TIGR04255 family)
MDNKYPDQPPVGEVAFSLQFDPINKLHSGVAWSFLNEHFPEWPFMAELGPIDDQFEEFTEFPPSAGARLLPMQSAGRLVIESPTKDRLCQLQKTRIVLNWRQGYDDYPEYNVLQRQFLEIWEKFNDFLEQRSIGALKPNQWELVYIDVFARHTYWDTFEDWANILPGLFSSSPVAPSLKMANRTASWSYDLPKHDGRLHVSANFGKSGTSDSLLLNTTARGGIRSTDIDSIRTCFDSAHTLVVNSFKSYVSQGILRHCK